MPQNLLTVDQAARELGVSVGRVRQMLRAGTLAGEKVSDRLWLVRRGSVRSVKERKKGPGRPRGGYQGEPSREWSSIR